MSRSRAATLSAGAITMLAVFNGLVGNLLANQWWDWALASIFAGLTVALVLLDMLRARQSHPPRSAEPAPTGYVSGIAGNQTNIGTTVNQWVHINNYGIDTTTEHKDPPSPETSTPRSEGKPTRRWPRALRLLFLLILVGAMFTFGFMPRPTPTTASPPAPSPTPSSASTPTPAPAAVAVPAAKSTPVSKPTRRAPNPTPTPTSTMPAGTIVFTDDFTDNVKGRWSTFGRQTPDQGTINGRLVLISDPEPTQAFSDVISGIVDQGMDTIMELDVIAADGRGELGVLCRYDNRDNSGYMFAIKDGEHVGISKMIGDQYVSLPGGEWRPATAHLGTGFNHVVAACRTVGATVRLELWINNVLAVEVTDMTTNPLTAGTLGFYADADPAVPQEMSVEFDNLVVKRP